MVKLKGFYFKCKNAEFTNETIEEIEIVYEPEKGLC